MKTYCTILYQNVITVGYCGESLEKASDYNLVKGSLSANLNVWEDGKIIEVHFWTSADGWEIFKEGDF